MWCSRPSPVIRALGAVVGLLALAPPGATTASHHPPLDAAILEGFRAPATPYGPGHRGVDLAAGGGEAVRVSAPGRVAFAGRVAGVLWVAVDHPDGLRTTYGGLSSVAVRDGDVLGPRAVLGRAAGAAHGRPGRLHWGARRAGRYIDPRSLLAVERAVLVGPGGWWIEERPAGPGRGGRGPPGRLPSRRRPASRGPFA